MKTGTQDTELAPDAALEAALSATEAARWHHFYADRARPVPFFGLAPDENLAQWLDDGAIAPGTALDIGCGNARNSLLLAKRGCAVTAIDYSDSAIAWARDEIAKAAATIGLRHGSIFDLELAPGTLDLVYDSGCFHHIEPRRRERYVRLVADALKPGGLFGLVCFAPEGGSGMTDAEVYERGTLGGGLGYDEERLREIWSADFEILELRRMRELPPGDALFGRGFLWTLLARRRAA